MGFLDTKPLVFVDIETNGLDHIRGRVIEVAAIRVENGKVCDTFVTLVNPKSELPQFITSLTGIKPEELYEAPYFSDIADSLYKILDGAVFVAHNVRFDYAFLKQEFKRLNIPFLPTQLCTVKLSRSLYPEERSHKLASLIERHGLQFSQRHRAYDDALVLWQFLQHVYSSFTIEQVEQAIAKQIRRPALPGNIEPEIVRNLPESTGVYIFKDELGQPLYVGKSINIKKRVLQHFGDDHSSNKEFKISQSVHQISTHTTDGELAALLLEAQLVKELQPVYNRQLRRLSKLIILKKYINSDGYNQISVEQADALSLNDTSETLAILTSRGKAKDILNELSTTYNLCPKLLGLEKTKNACFWYQLNKCGGACAGKEPSEIYNARLMTAFERLRIQDWPFKDAVLIQEKSASSDSNYGIIVDKWCVIAEISQQPDCEPVVKHRGNLFDLDTYKILQRYFNAKIKNLNIQILNKNQLVELGI